jgi:hypothetical protein
MREKLITEMSREEFDAVIDAYIERETQDLGELLAPVFYQTLREILSAEAIEETIELQAELEGNRLILHPPVPPPPLVMVHDNEIVVNNVRLIIHITPQVSQVL